MRENKRKTSQNWSTHTPAPRLTRLGCSDVDRNLQIVCPKSMSMRVRIREQSRLQHTIRRRFNSRNHVGRSESGLLDLERREQG
jgi:hypothetical protein